jgi:hypothetical protein
MRLSYTPDYAASNHDYIYSTQCDPTQPDAAHLDSISYTTSQANPYTAQYFHTYSHIWQI